MELSSIAPLLLQNMAQETLVKSEVPLYAAIAASPSCVIYYENKNLSICNRNPFSKKKISWKSDDGHVIDICWYKNQEFIILTKRKFYLFNADTEQVELLNKSSDHRPRSNYHRCTSYNESIMLCTLGSKTIIQEWTAEEFKCQWNSPKSCKKTENISCLSLSSYGVGMIIVKLKEKKPRFELRQANSMKPVFSIDMTQFSYRFIPINDHKWLLVPYYHQREELLVLDSNENKFETINIPKSSSTIDYNRSSYEMIWNIALMSGTDPCLIIRREKSICFYNNIT